MCTCFCKVFDFMKFTYKFHILRSKLDKIIISSHSSNMTCQVCIVQIWVYVCSHGQIFFVGQLIDMFPLEKNISPPTQGSLVACSSLHTIEAPWIFPCPLWHAHFWCHCPADVWDVHDCKISLVSFLSF